MKKRRFFLNSPAVAESPAGNEKPRQTGSAAMWGWGALGVVLLAVACGFVISGPKNTKGPGAGDASSARSNRSTAGGRHQQEAERQRGAQEKARREQGTGVPMDAATAPVTSETTVAEDQQAPQQGEAAVATPVAEERRERQEGLAAVAVTEVVAGAGVMDPSTGAGVMTIDLGGGVTLQLCKIPEGSFTMGSPAGTWGKLYGETQHQVKVSSAFWLGRTEVTQAQWQEVMGDNPCQLKQQDLPVENVNWDEATEFCRKLNRKNPLPAGWTWALPTEAQWEYACRAETTEDFAGDLDEMAWYERNSDRRTHPVATMKANAWGVHDMHGNVSEWCADWYGPYPSGPVTDPTGPGEGSSRVYRGGSWGRGGSYCRSAYRSWSPPDLRYISLGLRVAAVPPQREEAATVIVAAQGGAGAGNGRGTTPGEAKTEGMAAATDGGEELVGQVAGNAPGEVTTEEQVEAQAEELAGPKAGDVWSVDTRGGLKLDLCFIPAGKFRNYSRGAQEVTLTKAFWLGRTEVTQGQWQAVMEKNPSKAAGHNNLPVESVSWKDAMDFCRCLNSHVGLLPEGWKWALPTEAQWEYACGAGFGGGGSGSSWDWTNSGNTTHPVATKRANPWGLYDMGGNVSEWCADWYGESPTKPVTDPAGPNSGTARVICGASWAREERGDSDSGGRRRNTPDYRSNALGFRVAAVPVGK